MKTLQTDQQQELQELLAHLDHANLSQLSLEVKSSLTFWQNELKPKRVRRNPKEVS
jgi:hypothetical protein